MALGVRGNHYNDLLRRLGGWDGRHGRSAGGGRADQAVLDTLPDRTPRVIGIPRGKFTICDNPLHLTGKITRNILGGGQFETSNGQGRDKGKGIGAHFVWSCADNKRKAWVSGAGEYRTSSRRTRLSTLQAKDPGGVLVAVDAVMSDISRLRPRFVTGASIQKVGTQSQQPCPFPSQMMDEEMGVSTGNRIQVRHEANRARSTGCKNEWKGVRQKDLERPERVASRKERVWAIEAVRERAAAYK